MCFNFEKFYLESLKPKSLRPIIQQDLSQNKDAGWITVTYHSPGVCEALLASPGPYPESSTPHSCGSPLLLENLLWISGDAEGSVCS